MSSDAPDKVAEFFGQYPLRAYPKGQILIHAGDNPEKLLYLETGNVRQYDISYRGDEIIVNVFKPGAFFPMLLALTKLPNRYFFAADSAVEIRQAPHEEVLEFLKENPDVLFDLMTRVYKGLDGVLGRMVHLMSGSAKSRLLYELAIEAQRFGKKTKNGQELTINESELAGRAGLSRETVSREMNKISRDGLVTVSHSKIIVIDLEKLIVRLSKTV